MSTLLFRLGHVAARHPWRVISSWIVVAAAVVLLNSNLGGEANDTFRLPGAESQRAADMLEDEFPSQGQFTSQVVFGDDQALTDPASRLVIEDAVNELTGMPHVVSVTDPFAASAPTVSPDASVALSTVTFDTNDLEQIDVEAADHALAPARSAGLTAEYNGLLGAAGGETEAHSELIGMGIAVLVLVLAFGSLVAMSLPIGVALISLLVGTSTIGVLSGFVTIPTSATLVGSMLGLGVGIDYALFVLARHRENLLGPGLNIHDSAGRANATAGLSVLFAGGTVILAIAGLQLAGVPMISAMGWSSALMVAVTVVAALTLLPALLGLSGRHINRLRVVRPRARRHPEGSWSARWAHHVAARPLRYLLGALAVLALIASPVAGLRIAFPDDGNTSPDSPLRQSYDLIADGFGPGANGPLQVVVDLEESSRPRQLLEELATDLGEAPGVAAVHPPALNEARDLAVLTVIPTTAPQDEETAQLVDRLRADVLPPLADAHGVEAMVTGSAALQVDVADKLRDRMPWFIAAVLTLSLLILIPIFRSIVVPLKAAALNLVSIGAAYGVIVAVFQWGWGSEYIGVEAGMPINPLAPMLMFAILFGLSMDYEVFLLGRVREEYRDHRDPRRALVTGVAATAPVITSAALIMISVFYAFMLSTDITSKLFGLGLGTAILLDVTLVRMVLVPAAMSLLGHRAWRLPRWLDRVLPDVDLDGHRAAASPPATMEPVPTYAGHSGAAVESRVSR